MSFKGFIKSKTLGEYLQAKKDPQLMEEIENRGVKTVLKESSKASSELIEVRNQKKIEKNKYSRKEKNYIRNYSEINIRKNSCDQLY